MNGIRLDTVQLIAFGADVLVLFLGFEIRLGVFYHELNAGLQAVPVKREHAVGILVQPKQFDHRFFQALERGMFSQGVGEARENILVRRFGRRRRFGGQG